MSTGAKFFIGCLGVLAVMGIVGIVLAYAVFNVVGDRVGDFAGGLEQQQEAQETLVRLQREHTFQQPSDGVVTPAQAETFFQVTDELWEEMRPWADELEDLALRMEERDQPSLTDMAAGFRTMGRFVEGRLVFADAMDRHDLSAHEYLWTGMSLMRAYEELDRDEERRTVAPENIRLAERHRSELEEIHRASSDGRPDRGAVFHLSMLWGMTDGSAWQAMGLDTLMHEYR
ncbi:MAG: hypothetical protein WEA09_09595 [Gemmatimonadota bacterium]